MLIKLYTLTGNLHIIGNVSNVIVSGIVKDHEPITNAAISDTVTGESYNPEDVGTIGEDGAVELYYDSCPRCCASIRFTDDDGVVFRLFVANHAYICNNDGKTIEKVAP